MSNGDNTSSWPRQQFITRESVQSRRLSRPGYLLCRTGYSHKRFSSSHMCFRYSGMANRLSDSYIFFREQSNSKTKSIVKSRMGGNDISPTKV